MIHEFLTDLVKLGQEFEALIVNQMCEDERICRFWRLAFRLSLHELCAFQVRLRHLRRSSQINVAREEIGDDVEDF